MSSKIEWCDETRNRVTGCTPVSEGCQNCYAARMAKRLAGRFGYPKDEPFRPGTVRARAFLPWRLPRRVFLSSMGDLFHDAVLTKFIVQELSLAVECPEHTFIVLTKRPERMREIMSGDEFYPDRYGEVYGDMGRAFPPDNLWLGVTAENQQRGDERIPILLETPAALRFVSVEPMLGPVEIWRWLHCPRSKPCHGPRPGCDDLCDVCWGSDGLRWVICGPETGPGKRRFDPEWARDLYRQCKAAGVSFFWKGKEDIGLPKEWPE